jgi:hypothetical protein
MCHSGYCTCLRVIQAPPASQEAAVVRSGRQRLPSKSVGGIHQVSEGWTVKEDGLANVQSERYSPYALFCLSLNHCQYAETTPLYRHDSCRTLR